MSIGFKRFRKKIFFDLRNPGLVAAKIGDYQQQSRLNIRAAFIFF